MAFKGAWGGITAAKIIKAAHEEEEKVALACSNVVPREHDIGKLLLRNKEWARKKRQGDPTFFDTSCHVQHPEYLWIGCSDSRVPANSILGLDAGDIFVQRNVGNQALHHDMNALSCLEYGVTALKVKTIIVCGHYNCGAVKAALTMSHTIPSIVNCWITDIRDCRNAHHCELEACKDGDAQLSRLCELNVLRQVFNVATSPVVAKAWENGQELNLYGLIYNLADGLVTRLAGPINAKMDHNLEGFMASGFTVERCDVTKELRIRHDQHKPEVAAKMAPHELQVSVNTANVMEHLKRHASFSEKAAANGDGH